MGNYCEVLCLPLVPGSWATEALGREAGTRAWGDPEGLWGEQQLHQERQGEAGAEDGGQQGKQGGPVGGHAWEAAGEGRTQQAAVWPNVCTSKQRRIPKWKSVFHFCLHFFPMKQIIESEEMWSVLDQNKRETRSQQGLMFFHQEFWMESLHPVVEFYTLFEASSSHLASHIFCSFF